MPVNDIHTYAISAYKESEYLEECILSLKKQTVQTNLVMTTSTPCDHIINLAKKYDIPLSIKETGSDIRDDWNFAYNHARTPWVTIAHQDDLYDPHYVEELLAKIRVVPDAVAFVTDYIPIKHGVVGERDINSKIRHFLRTPLKSTALSRSKFWKRAVISLGNSICCPSVSYNKAVLGDSFFTSDLKYDIDWDTFHKLGGLDGAFAYVDKPLTFYRVHEGATSMEWINNHTRELDDTVMFRKFWPRWMTRILMHFYKKAYVTYQD